ncbi:hypothetical protein NY08_5027 [Rhodococcus sp. B7740]|nr:hypothetical protein NY08_5027 [Rhodococcus sp. B7740]
MPGLHVFLFVTVDRTQPRRALRAPRVLPATFFDEQDHS